MQLEIKPRDMDEILATDNVAELYSAAELSNIANYLGQGYENDERTMASYKRRANQAVKLARMDNGGKDKTFPFVNASNIMMPYLAEAALEFNSRVKGEFTHKQLTKAEVIGRDKSGMKEKRARRVKTTIDYVINHELDNKQDQNWRKDTDRATLYWSITGMFFRKNWHCSLTDQQKSCLIFATEMVYDHSAESFEAAPRKTHPLPTSRNDAVTMMRSGQWIPIELPEEASYGTSGDGRYDGTTPPESGENYDFIEMHCELDLDQDDYAEPYIVTMFKTDQKVVSIVKRYDEADIDRNDDGEVVRIDGEEFYTQYGFIPDVAPEAKAVYVGWGIMLYDALEAINTMTNQLIDAGTLQNTSANSGFIDNSVMRAGASATKKGKVELIMGQFTQVQTGASSRPLRDSLVQFPFAGPSQALFNLLEALKGDLRRMVAASANLEANANEAAELYLARLQQAMKVPNSLGTRLYEGFTQEMRRIAYLVNRYSDNEWYNDVLDEDEEGEEYFIELDFDDERIAISPTADPRMGSETERIQKATIVKEEAKTQPLPVINLREAYVNWLDALNVDNIERFIPPPDPKQGEQADKLSQLQQMYAQADAKQKELDSQSKMLNAQANMLKAQGEARKVQAEIENILSDTMKNLSEVEANRIKNKIAVMHEEFAGITGIIDRAINGAERAYDRQANNSAGGTVVNRPGNSGLS